MREGHVNPINLNIPHDNPHNNSSHLNNPSKASKTSKPNQPNQPNQPIEPSKPSKPSKLNKRSGKRVYSIAMKSLKANKTRNLLMMSAVVLTTLLFTSIFTMGLSVNKSMELAAMKTAGSDFHGSFKYLTQSEAQRLSGHPSVRESGRALLVGELVHPALQTNRVEIDYVDDQYAKHGFIRFDEGGLPAGENDIALNTWTLDLLGIPHELGAKVKLDIDIGHGVIITNDFQLAGYYEADQYVAMAGIAFVSEEFVQKYISHVDPEQSIKEGTYTNTIQMGVMFGNAWNIESKVKKVLADTGLDVPYGVNWAYSSVSLTENVMNIVPYLLLVLIIMLSGYLLIYNIFHISVVKDIRFYGLLKTMGTTAKQLRAIISIQAHYLYLLSLPIGLALGYAAGCWITPMMLRFSDMKLESVYSWNPLIFIGAALFAYLTVRAAASKPGKIAAKIAPVEAVKYAGVSADSGRGAKGAGRVSVKRSISGARLYNMAWGNLWRSKKKLLLMLASLVLSITLFSMIFTIIASFDVNKYLNAYISGDFVVKDEGYKDPSGASAALISEELASTLSSIDGVQSLDKVYYKGDLFPVDARIKKLLEAEMAEEGLKRQIIESLLADGQLAIQLYGLGDGWLDTLSEHDVAAGKFDHEKFKTGDYVLLTQSQVAEDEYVSYYQPGDRFQLPGDKQSYEVMAILKTEAFYAAGTQFFGVGGFNVYFPAAAFREVEEQPDILSATLHVDPSKHEQAGRAVQALTKGIEGRLAVKSREDYKQELAGFITIFQTVGYGLSFIIALIGVLNYINTVITGVLSRRNEFAVLESIGMTKRQLNKMLLYEGCYVVLLTGLLTWTFGLLATYFIVKGIAGNMAFTTFRMNVLPVASTTVVLLVISYFVTKTAYRILSRATIVERLREVE
ncbi:ABC transporter permease [Paenibacillus fonticola]|uniref:ABC transporter permease n=1 Tax=Paenibacillus fonticola TaxID=379896 RepID=UPI001F0AC3E5|nr:FtsX-like permease family protein [Paenibacillus fonticola]